MTNVIEQDLELDSVPQPVQRDKNPQFENYIQFRFLPAISCISKSTIVPRGVYGHPLNQCCALIARAIDRRAHGVADHLFAGIKPQQVFE